MSKFRKILTKNRGKFVVLKPIALGDSKITIKNYEKLPRIHYAVFTEKQDKIQYHGVTVGVDRRDALNQITDLYKGPYWLNSRDIKLLIIENNKIKKDIFADKKVDDLTLNDESVSTPLKTPYFKIKGEVIEQKEKEPIVVEAELY